MLGINFSRTFLSSSLLWLMSKFLASSRPRLRKTRIKSLTLKMAKKKAKIPRNSSPRPGKGQNSSPRLVLDLKKNPKACPQPRKTRTKSLVLKMAEKKAKIPRNSSSHPRKGRGKGKNFLPRLVLDLGKILPMVLSSSSPDDPSRTSAAFA